ncbi:MAG TPA: efflux transporter outer membrane subunit [Caulobacteraceae bacterium]
MTEGAQRRSAPFAGLALAAGLCGCLVGPNYHRPSAPISATFKEAQGWVPAQPSDAADRTDWWTVFGDPTLNALEAKVAISNQNLAAAEAAYRSARALVSEQRAALFPLISLTGSATVSGGGGGGGTTTTAAGGTVTSGRGTQTDYRLGLGATWEPDLWGRIRRTIENARANAQASKADLANARLSAQMELAVDYIQMRQLDEEKRLLDETDTGYARSLTITQNRYRVGVAAKSDVLSAQSQLQTTQSQAVDLIQQRARLEHAIAILAGEAPADLTLAAGPWALEAPQIPPGLPSELLQRRPDVASAERKADAANALIGVQKSAYYPDLTLSASPGFDASNLANLFNASSFFWSLGASVTETLFDAGARRARVAEARATYDEAVATYRQTVLTALGQVEDNLAAQRMLSQELSLSQSASTAADQNEVIARNQYLAGQSDYTAVVVAQATALAARRSAVQIASTQLTTAVDLIAALGGGWRA